MLENITKNLLGILLVILLLMPLNFNGEPADPEQNKKLEWSEIGIYRNELSHQQEIWLAVLEWCESRGIKTAVNPKDRDGTPSYYSFQFKPSTFKGYAIRYELLPADLEDEDYFNHMSDYELMKEIVRRMIGDPQVNWRWEFPDCVRKFGEPPK
jgi:hypothetical protein